MGANAKCYLGWQIHAETTAGGLPGWVVQTPEIEARTNSTTYTKAWKAYMKEIGAIIAKNQIGAGGTDTVILVQAENEYRTSWVSLFFGCSY
jgi:hypothetical protein